MPVVGPDGAPEAFTWVVGTEEGPLLTEIDSNGGPDHQWAEVEQLPVAWVVLMPQRPGLPHHALRIPLGAQAWFTRRRVREGEVGVPDSDRHVGSWTGFGWRTNVGLGPSMFFRDDGSSVSGIDDGTLTNPMEVVIS